MTVIGIEPSQGAVDSERLRKIVEGLGNFDMQNLARRPDILFGSQPSDGIYILSDNALLPHNPRTNSTNGSGFETGGNGFGVDIDPR